MTGRQDDMMKDRQRILDEYMIRKNFYLPGQKFHLGSSVLENRTIIAADGYVFLVKLRNNLAAA